MRSRIPFLLSGIALCLIGSGIARGKEGAGKARAKAAEPETRKSEAKARREVATFGGGCFWCLEAVFERVKGVQSVVSGYAGGTVSRPFYELVKTGLTGHAEVVQITYDPDVVSYDDLLEVFWSSHDPTTPNQQGPDFGTQYRSIILYHDDAQRLAALASIEKLTTSGVPVVTQVVPLRKFWLAEKHHQDYYRRFPNAAYCRMYIAPKILKLKHKAAAESGAGH